MPTAGQDNLYKKVELVGTTTSSGEAAGLLQISGVGMKGIAHNRNIVAAATTVPVDRSNNYVSFTSAEAVRELTINAIGSAGGSVANDDAYLVVINAPSSGIAKSWLDDVGAEGQDVQYEIGYIGVPLVIQRTTDILHVDVKPISEIMRFGISAVGVIA